MKSTFSQHGTRSSPRAVDAWVAQDRTFMVRLSDGRMVLVRPTASVRLRRATRKQLGNFQILNDGEGIIWPDLDEALSVRGFIQQSKATPKVVEVVPAHRESRRSRSSAAFR